MRDQGRLVEWFDEKVMALFSRMMLKKSESFAYQRFCTPRTLPIIGCALEYLVILDERSFRAQQVTYLKASQTRKALKPAKTQSSFQYQPMVCYANGDCVLFRFNGHYEFYSYFAGLYLIVCLNDECVELLAIFTR